MTFPSVLSSGPPEFPGLMVALVWIMPRRTFPLSSLTGRLRPEMIPVTIVLS